MRARARIRLARRLGKSSQFLKEGRRHLPVKGVGHLFPFPKLPVLHRLIRVRWDIFIQRSKNHVHHARPRRFTSRHPCLVNHGKLLF